MEKETEKAPISGLPFMIHLLGWELPREVIIKDGYVYFQVAGESHCSGCQSRIKSIKSIDSPEIRYAYLGSGSFIEHFRGVKMLWAGVPISKDATRSDALAALKKTFKLCFL
ncbi:MAG: hypothetical protein NTY12_00220 [Candidatus Falkowbacteria bacterium]|nr:hypothetical protein [Candidatus Falkowbacteria bacterium]